MVKLDGFRDYLYGKYGNDRQGGEISEERIDAFLKKNENNIEIYMNRRGLEKLDTKVGYKYVEQKLEETFAVGLREEMRTTLTKNEAKEQLREFREKFRAAQRDIRKEQERVADLRKQTQQIDRSLAGVNARYEKIKNIVLSKSQGGAALKSPTDDMERFEKIQGNEKALSEIAEKYQSRDVLDKLRASGYEVGVARMAPPGTEGEGATNFQLTKITVSQVTPTLRGQNRMQPVYSIENTMDGKLKITEYKPALSAGIDTHREAGSRMVDNVRAFSDRLDMAMGAQKREKQVM